MLQKNLTFSIEYSGYNKKPTIKSGKEVSAMLSVTQDIASILISAIGAIVAILLLTGVIIWLGKELITKRRTVLKWVLIILFVCVVISFMPQII